MNVDVFVTRNFEIGDVTVPVRFFRPVPEDVDFRCDYEIDFPSWQRKFHGYGVDEVQALLLAMSAAHVDLLATRRDDRLDLTWLEGRDLHLPLPQNTKAEDFDR